MFSNSSVAVDKGLGFDFSDIANLVKTALPVGLNIFKQQQQIKAIKSGVLPAAQTYNVQPTFTQPGYAPLQSSGIGINTNTILMIGGVVVGGIILYKML